MKINIKSPVLMAAFIALTVGSTGIFSRAESVTAQQNLEKLKETNSCRGCDLSGLTLNRMNLAGADLEGADFSLTKFHLSNLSGANLRNANLKGASFGGTDLGEADLRGADLRGTSLDGAYLDQTLLDGEFITAKPYEEIGVTDVEKQVYVPNPEKPKKSPETRDVKVAVRSDHEESPPRPSVEQKAKPSPEKKTETATADNVATTTDEQRPSAPTAKKAVPVRQAIVEPQEQTEQAKTEPTGVPKPSLTKDENTLSSTPESLPQKMAITGKPSPVPPPEVKMDEVQPVTTQAKPVSEGGARKSDANLVMDKSKKDLMARLLGEDKCLGCDLSGLDLSGKNLKNVDLEKANLTGCNLERVNLEKANLKGAILQNAILRMASLKNADLYKADLSGADLSGANVQGAKFDNAKISSVIGLETGPVVK